LLQGSLAAVAHTQVVQTDHGASGAFAQFTASHNSINSGATAAMRNQAGQARNEGARRKKDKGLELITRRSLQGLDKYPEADSLNCNQIALKSNANMLL
jgi:predicted RecA/RadA family phage recombinase